MVIETEIALAFAAVCTATIFAFSRKWLAAGVIPFVLLVIYLADVGRVNAKFLFVVDAPHKVNEAKTPVVEFLAKESKTIRAVPMDGTDPMTFVRNGIPVMFTSNPVQQQRWQNFLDAFNLTSAMPDMLNVKYFVYGAAQYAQDKAQLGDKFQIAFQSPGGGQVVLENKNVLPKGWLVPAVAQINNLQQTFDILQNPSFDPRKVAIVESPPPFPLADPQSGAAIASNNVLVSTYEGERIVVTAKVPQNALLVLGEKYYRGWKATMDSKSVEIVPVNHVLRGVYLPPGDHTVEFVFDPLPYKVGKWLTLSSFVFFAAMLVREWLIWKRVKGADTGRSQAI
jgi:hypothetical protein